MIILSRQQIIALHSQLITETGGAPFQSFDNTNVYPSLQQKAARLGFGLVRNHAFIDGNKRIGAHAMLVFLALNDIELEYTQEELSDTFLGIA